MSVSQDSVRWPSLSHSGLFTVGSTCKYYSIVLYVHKVLYCVTIPLSENEVVYSCAVQVQLVLIQGIMLDSFGISSLSHARLCGLLDHTAVGWLHLSLCICNIHSFVNGEKTKVVVDAFPDVEGNSVIVGRCLQ